MTEIDGKGTIYGLYTKSQKASILLASAVIAIITPFTDTVYLPALSSVATSLNASDASVAATVSAYLGAVGIGQLIWGPLSDYYGRLIVLLAGLIIYEAFTVACIFADNIDTLIALRTIEGLIVGSSIVTVQAIIADAFPEEERGQAMGAFMVLTYFAKLLIPYGSCLYFFNNYSSTDSNACWSYYSSSNR